MAQEPKPTISYDDFAKLELRVGEILSAEKVPETDRLLKLSVNLGDAEPRQIISGIAEYFPDTEALVGTRCIFVSNLAPRVIKGLESQGMILAATGEEGAFSLIVPQQSMPPGTRLR
jgi:methionyl-tRNA synthetase